MLFCDKCLEEHYLNKPSLFRSYGDCELCKEIVDCNDIDINLLKRKDAEKPQCGLNEAYQGLFRGDHLS